jgi:hypothetical protein
VSTRSHVDVALAALAEVGVYASDPGRHDAVRASIHSPVHLMYRANGLARMARGEPPRSPDEYRARFEALNPGLTLPATDADLASMQRFYDIHGDAA